MNATDRIDFSVGDDAVKDVYAGVLLVHSLVAAIKGGNLVSMRRCWSRGRDECVVVMQKTAEALDTVPERAVKPSPPRQMYRF